MKKFLLCFVLIILLTGCNVNYELEISNNKMIENVIINNVDVNKFNDINIPINHEQNDYSVIETKNEDILYYNITKGNNKININYLFDEDNYRYSTLLNHCYINVNFSYDEHEILLSTGDEFLCYNYYDGLEDVIVKIKSKYLLYDTNADKIDGYNYYWYINKDNKDNKPIYLRLDAVEKKKSLTDKIKDLGLFPALLLLTVFAIVLMICFLFKKIGNYRDRV